MQDLQDPVAIAESLGVIIDVELFESHKQYGDSETERSHRDIKQLKSIGLNCAQE